MSQKPLRTLFLWVIWAATALVVYVTLYQDSQVLQFLANDSSRITWLIVGLFLFGIISSFVLTLIITFESIVALRVEGIVRKHGLRGLTIDTTRRAVYRFFAALKDTIEANGQPDIDALLNVELASYHRVSHSVEMIGNLLITLGLIGTVMGLTMTLTGLTTSLDALGHNQEMLLAGLRKAMAGMGTAFYTTLLGAILGGVLLRVFAQISDNGVEGLFDKLMRMCLVYCSADLQPSLERDMRTLDAEIDMLSKRINTLQASFDETRGAMSAFREETARLRELSQQENDTLLKNIMLHQQHSEILRQEARMMNKLNRPLWRRILAALGLEK